MNNPFKKIKFQGDISGKIFFIFALSALSALAVITIFIIIQAVPFFAEVGVFNFIFGSDWAPTHDQYGIFPMIIGSITVTLGAIILGVPIGVCCAIFLTEFAPVRIRNIFRPAIQLLAAIPSVVYGFVGLMFVVPFIRNFMGGPGLSMLAGSIILALMILPTVISISEVAMLSLPKQYKEGALALGMTKWQSIWSVQVPAAKSGIIASIILGIGRAIGETMAVIMVVGNATALPESILDPIRTLTTNIGIEMGYATGTHRAALFATGVILFIMIMIINSIAQYIVHGKIKKTEKSKASQQTNTKEASEEIHSYINKETAIAETAKTNGIKTKTGKKRLISPQLTGKIAKTVIWAAAVFVLTVLAAIIIYLLVKGLPEINWKFLTQPPRGMGDEGGISSTIVGTLYVTFLAILIAVPFGIGTAFYLAEYTKDNVFTRIIRFCVESLAGIPSIIYGLFGFIFFVIYLQMGWSILAGGLTLAIMILPTIIRTSEEAIKTVPQSYRETAYSLGATKWQTLYKVVFPSALRGIVNGTILSVGRCVAETAAVMLTVGSAIRMPGSIFDSTRTMATHFYQLVTEGLPLENAFGTAALLIILIFIINVVANTLVNRFVSKRK